MAIIKNGKITVILGIIINIIFLVLKFIIFLYSKVGLFFSDAIDSFVDGFVIFMVVLFLRFDLNGTLTYLNMDIMFISQWCVIIVFRLIIFLEQIEDLRNPEQRERPELIIIVSIIVIVGGIFFDVIICR